MTSMRVGSGSDVGRVRKSNEDAFWHDGRLFIVADGMGGHAAGEIASRIATETIRSWRFPDETAPEEVDRSAVREALLAANQAVYEKAQKDPACRGMGTTLTLALLSSSRATLGHVGDSRAYLIRDGRLIQLTEDHSVVAELIRSGGLTEEEASAHPFRNLLTRALGTARDVEVDVETVRLEAGDGLLLCTDGLSGVLSDGELLRLASEAADPQSAVVRLLEAANAAGGPDNITAILIWPEVGERA